MSQYSPPPWHTARLRPQSMWRYRLWREGHRQAILGSRRSVARATLDDESHLRAAAQWLALAQDQTADGGVVGRYRLDRGWTSSYPETTGYLVPTFLNLIPLDAQFHARARRCIEFLLEIQLDNGAFPAGEIATNQIKPSPFNSAQIINGLLDWHERENEPETLEAARRSGHWLVTQQDADGAWRRWFYNDTPATYSAHLSCWLAELGAACNDTEFLDSAKRHLDWVLAQRHSETGWFDQCGFTVEEQTARVADLHTIAYTLAGILRTAAVLKREDAIQAVGVAARAIATTLQELDWLPGIFDFKWRQRADSACLTGNSQIALIWMALYRIDGDDRWLDAAFRAIDLVKQAQLVHVNDPNLHGAIPGSDPMWGWYNDGIVLNWAAKFFVDALLSKAAIERARRS